MCSRSVRVSYQNQTRTNRRSDTLNLGVLPGGGGNSLIWPYGLMGICRCIGYNFQDLEGI